MSLSNLFKGIAIVIDDEVHDKSANITNIKKQINKKEIPCVMYTEIPSDEAVSNFKGVSFVLLDWWLDDPEITDDLRVEGLRTPAEIRKLKIAENIEFIKKMKKVCFCPIFIFSNENVGLIKSALKKEKLYDDSQQNHILVKSKAELLGRKKLFIEIDKWISKNPSVYVLKEWEREYQNSQAKLFSEMETLSPVWPKIMWKNFSEDNSNASLDLGELISQNLHTRMAPFDFSNKILGKRVQKKVKKAEIRNVLEGAMYLSKENLHEDNIAPGDVFKEQGKYYLNIRAACDCISDRSGGESSVDEIELYLLKGTKMRDKIVKSLFKRKYGHFSELDSQSIVFPMDSGKSIDFRFKELMIKSWGELKSKRIGRVLPPHINKILQRYALYMHRQDLPRVPRKALP